jgi:hypothetical protein
MAYKLGKLAPKYSYKTIPFGHIVAEGLLPSPATKVYREYKTPAAAKQMFGNDQYGDCTCAGIANMLILATSHTGTVVIPTLQNVLDLYTAVTGFNQQTGANDNGAAMTDVLAYVQKNGFCGHKILGWAQIDHNNLVHRQLGCDLFGGTYVGVNLPMNAQQQFANSQSWEVVPNDTIEGGHCIIRPGYGSLGDDYVTWANWEQKASSAWSITYVEEEYVIITEDWINQATKKTPGGIDLATLETYLKLVSV